MRRITRLGSDLASVERHFYARMQRVVAFGKLAHLEPSPRRAEMTLAAELAHADAYMLGALHDMDRADVHGAEYAARCAS